MTARTRREHGSGGVYQRASDGRWIATIEAGTTISGTRRRITVSAKTESECKAKLKKKRQEIDLNGAPAAGVHGSTTVKTWAAEWLKMHERAVRPKTFATDRSSVGRWIIPTIGRRRLAELTPADVRQVTTAVSDAGRSSTTARYAQGVLTRMLRAAIVEGHAVPQRVLMTKAPAKAASTRGAIPIEQAKAILAVAADQPGGSRWVAALLQGMRQAECIGLTWECVDFDRGLIDVSWQLQQLPYKDRARGIFRVPDGYEARQLRLSWHLVRPKTSSGYRVLPMLPWFATSLQTWKEIAPESKYGLVWARPNGDPLDPPEDSEAWNATQEAAGVAKADGERYTLHEARHTTATLLMEANVPDVVVTSILGHSSIVTSKGYQHAADKQTRDAMEQVAGLLGLGA